MKNLIIALLLPACVASASESTYVNPVDGREYRAEWKTYLPEGGAADQSDRLVEMKTTRLLSTQDEFEKNVSVNELAEFIKATQNNIEKNITLPTEGFELLVDTKLSATKDPEFDIASQGSVTREQLQKIYSGLQEMKGFRSKSSELKYQIHYVIKKKS